MIKLFLLHLISFIIVIPFSAFIHELGHGIMALLFTKDCINIKLGNGKLNKDMKLKRINIKINGYSSINDINFGQVFWSEIKDVKKNILVFLGGPLISLTLSIITLLIIINFNFNIIVLIMLRTITLYNFSVFLITIIPIEYNSYPYKGMKSDGYRIKELLKVRDI